MISQEDSLYNYDYQGKILPQINDWGKDNKRIKNGIKVKEGFVYSSDNNPQKMTKTDLKKWININQNYIGKI